MGHDKDHPLDCTESHVGCEDCEDFDATVEQHGLMSKNDKIKLTAITDMTQAFVFLYRTALLDLAANNTWYDLPFNIASGCKKNVTHDHTSNPEQITLTEGGTYEIIYRVTFEQGLNEIFTARILDDSTEIPGSSENKYTYIGNTLLVGPFLAFVAADSVIEMQVGTHAAGKDVLAKTGGSDPAPTTRVSATILMHKISDDTS